MSAPVGTEELLAVAEANRLIGQGGSLAEALRLQLTVLHELTGARTSFVALVDVPRGLLSVMASRGRSDPRVRAHALEEGILGRAFQSQEVVEADGCLALGFARAEAPVGALELVGIKSRPSDVTLAAMTSAIAASLGMALLQDELRQRKAELEQTSNAMKALDQQRDLFLGKVSHELKTPLTTVKTYLAMLLRHRLGALRPEQERALGIVDRNSDRLLRLIDDLLLTSRLEVGQMTLLDKPFALKLLLEECWSVSGKPAERAQVTLEPVQGGECFVRGDREHLRESLLGLLDNAIRYNVPGGKVWGRVSTLGSTVRVEVGDSGRGIAGEKVATLFDGFDAASEVNIRRKGAGSSLSRVRQVAQLHGGVLGVSSTPGQGSVFAVTLPLFAGLVTQSDVHPLPSGQRGGVLMVEDDDDCRESVQELLRIEGIDCVAVATAAEAIALLEKMTPAMVIVDLRLRVGDGRGVIQHVRRSATLSKLPVFVMSGAVGEASSFTTEGPDRIDGFFEKPLNLPRVLASIRAIVQAEATV
jgi:signal transduction histidine kinase/CheY-like chemotaxis protein